MPVPLLERPRMPSRCTDPALVLLGRVSVGHAVEDLPPERELHAALRAQHRDDSR